MLSAKIFLIAFKLTIAKLINASLKEKLESEAQELNLLKTKSTKLPF